MRVLRDGKSPFRDIVLDHRAGASVSGVADLYRGDQHRVDADPHVAAIHGKDLPDTVAALTAVRDRQMARKAGTADKDKMARPMLIEYRARIAQAKRAEIGFGERLAAFWANHFAIESDAGAIERGLAGAYEREAIRPNILGKFEDLLLAATRHPAMLAYLNNATSIGPDSPQGKRTGKGLNENHARELMELHTVGVDAGYTQADVTSFAKVLTGWTFGQGENDPEHYGRFVFRKQAHEPGPQTVMGKVYPQKGVDQGLAVIADLCASPATATHIATQFARYFVADAPDPALVKTLATTFTKTHGDLKALTLALLDAPAAWAAPAQKLRTPQEFLWAAVRALDLDVQPNLVNRTLTDLGEPLWNPPSPQGPRARSALP